MRIFIDESGSFTGNSGVSAVGALIVPDQNFNGFERLFGRLRHRLPKHNGEVKGRLLSEGNVSEVVQVLKRTGCLFEVVAVDSACQTDEEICSHKKAQAENITANLTDEHHEKVIAQTVALSEQLLSTPNQLYLQSCAMSELVYNVLFHANIYFSFRLPRELAEYHWVLDAKDKTKSTPWEKWWSSIVSPMIEYKSFEKPFAAVEGGDYRWHERFRMEPSDYKRQFMKDPDTADVFSLKPILKDDLRFSSDAELGLEAVDILVNTIRRSLNGNFRREGWLPVRELMIDQDRYIKLISLASDDRKISVKYMQVIKDFTAGGKPLWPPSYET